MNQLVQMFEDSNSRMKSIMKQTKKYSPEELSQAQREFEAQIKLLNAVISAHGIASKNKRAMVSMERMNLMDESTAIDFLECGREEDKVKCPNLHNPITRAECLDRSGSSTHYEECLKCDIGKASRRLCNVTELSKGE